MLVTDFTLRITGRPSQYVVHLEATGEADSVAAIREILRPLLGNLRLTSAEVDADLASMGSYEAHSLPTQGGLEDPAVLEQHAAQP
jgi:hypothetical protein